MVRLSIALGALLILASAARAAPPADDRARWEQARADERRFAHERLQRAGFEPIASVRGAGRDVRRLLLSDPYMILPVPGIEVERHADGRATLRLQYWAWSSDPVPIDADAWNALVADDDAVFVSPRYAPPRPSAAVAPSSPPPICHGWTGLLEADDRRVAWWGECGGSQGPVHAYTMRMLALAMATRKDCAFDRANPFWSFHQCLGPKPSLDDPKLQADYSLLLRDYEATPGADRLMEARQALAARPLSAEAWLKARDAVARVKETVDTRRERLEHLRRLADAAPNASPADRAKMRETIREWTDFLGAQDRNYADLVAQLERVRR